MKFLISTFLIVAHLFSTVGFSMEVHECGNEKSYTFYGISLCESCKCDHESSDHSNDCCQDKKSVVKSQIKDKMTCKVFISKKVHVDSEIQIPIVFLSNSIFSCSAHPAIYKTEFPPGNSPPFYVLYGDFLI